MTLQEESQFIFDEFSRRELAPQKGLAILIEAISRALVFCSAREDLDRNTAIAVKSILDAVPMYYELAQQMVEEEEI